VFAAPISQGQCNTFDPATGTFGEVRSSARRGQPRVARFARLERADQTLMFLSASRGAKAGTTPINAANLARQNAPVKQELLTAYESG
jgi:hypothetical protein